MKDRGKIILLGVAFLSFSALAQTPDTVPKDSSQWAIFLESIGGPKGAGIMGAIVTAIQILLRLLNSPFGYLAGPYKLVLVTGLTLFLGITGLRIEGFDWQSAIMHSTTLSAFQVFLYELYKQFIKK